MFGASVGHYTAGSLEGPAVGQKQHLQKPCIKCQAMASLSSRGKVHIVLCRCYAAYTPCSPFKSEVPFMTVFGIEKVSQLQTAF